MSPIFSINSSYSVAYNVAELTAFLTSGQLKSFEGSHIKRRYMFKLSEILGRSDGSDAFGRRAVKKNGIRKDIGQTFAETGTTNM